MTGSTASSLFPAHTGVLRVTGADAGEFLQAQLSSQVKDLSPSASCLTAWHDARGKVRAVVRLMRDDDGYLLAVPDDLTDQLLAAMQMYVLRADVRIAISDMRCAGFVTDTAADLIPMLPELPDRTDAVARSGPLSVICVAPGCWHVFGISNAIPLADSDIDPVAAAEIRAGLPQVDQRTTLRYVPHMLNLDSLGALDFEKGCYPGQEIIARTEHLGSVKRRACAFGIDTQRADDAVPASDTPVVDSNNEQIGEVLRAARDADGTIVLLAVVSLTALDDSAFLETPAGRQLRRMDLPFTQASE